ncbi:transcription antitermination factor NusB [Polynucleobacter kasalickyi]|uniref:Transcription antitermination protein NusB n=1 Tax=Polynucleobacter kasalickyi TaxID=1938817 RepID=A0A1W1Y1S9_9BURK|nr:transcription antitermination factor NusB [Polynucleobacter kasalickyi]SMC30106.1 NusB antitermination factor [Polynucleobacter kasalickyi]
MHNPYLTQAHKLISSTQVKRSLTPRRRAREYALQGIYQWLVVRSSGSLPSQSSIERQLAEDPGFKKAQDELFYALFDGVCSNLEALEAEILKHIDRPVEELSPVELSTLLIGAFELKFDLATPYKVAINEAVELAKTFGGTDGHKYVNGVLDKLAKDLRALEINS